MEKLIENIEKTRNLKQNSIRAYVINIKKLYEYIEPDNKKPMTNIDFLEKEKEIIEFLSNKALTTKKNYVSSIVIALDSSNESGKYDDLLENYRAKLDTYIDEYNKFLDSNEKSKKEDVNWTTLKELKKIVNSYKSDLMERKSFTKSILSVKEFEILQKYVVGSLYIFQEPVRLDYGDMEIITNNEYDKLSEDMLDTNNYLVIKSRNTKIFHFAKYKTSNTYGTKIISVSKKLNSILNIWLKYNKTDNFLLDSKGKIMSSNQLSKYLLKVFQPSGKRISVTMLRHIYISEIHPVSNEEAKEHTANNMMHSVAMQKQYSKNI